MENKDKEILFIAQYPENVSPNQRFRFELYKDILKENGFNISTHSFLKEKGYNVIHRRGFFFNKLWEVIKGYIRRTGLLFTLNKYGYIFLQREAAPLGPPVFEWIYSKVFRKKIIYDFDDAIWMEHISDQNNMARWFKSVSKVKKICKWSYKVSCGNEYLCNYARKYNNNVVYNPTCVDTGKRHNIMACHDVQRVTVGWTGTFSTLKYMETVIPILKKLQEKYDFDVKIICNQKPEFDLRNLHYIEWSEENEVKELATFQVGLMPLTNDEWSKGKCGFKLVQYLALGIPAISSPVGVNKRIVDNEINGILCETADDWYNAIEKLITEKDLRKKMGEEGRKKIIRDYSLVSNRQNFLGLFN